MNRFRFFLTLLLLILAATPVAAADHPRILLGIDVLEAQGFAPLQGKRVGLLTHPAGVNRFGRSTVEILDHSPLVNLRALFGPEHGIYGDEKANVPVDDKIDPHTNLPVYSLYGKYRRPTAKMLSGIDVMLIDLQDLGVRSYTYISCMRYVIEECFKHDVEVIVLDRPNPLGGLKVDGPPMDKQWMSYVGAYQVPYVHGLTIGELARMAANTPGILEIDEPTRRKGKLSVVPMRGWERSMLWHQTGLDWVPTSPAIPNLSAAMGYSMTGLGTQLGKFRHGYGTNFPFRMLQYPGRSPEEIAAELRKRNIPGLGYRIVQWKLPRGETRRGLYLTVTDWDALRPTEVSFWMMQIAAQWAAQAGEANPFASAPESASGLYNKHVGSQAWWNAITREGASVDVSRFVREWAAKARQFQRESRKFWIYQ